MHLVLLDIFRDWSAVAEFWNSTGRETLWLTYQHVYLVAIAMGIAVAVAVPLGIIIGHSKNRYLVSAVHGVVKVIQPIPSLALVALAMVLIAALTTAWPALRDVGIRAIGILPGLVALVAYALLPILLNTFTGIRQVDQTMIEVARGMGMNSWQILCRIELPLALPVIMAGVRISTVWTVGVATLVSLVGAGGLGDPIFTGIRSVDIGMIMSGVIPAIALALFFDFVLGRVEKWLTPKGLQLQES